MKYYAPNIAWHNKKAVYTVDIETNPVRSDNESIVYRVATGGSDARINIWHVRILEVTDLDKKKPVDKLECVAELTQHQRPVNVVRFMPPAIENASSNPSSTADVSPSKSASNHPDSDSRYMASGGNDALIHIWKLCDDDDDAESGSKESAGAPVFDEEVISIEKWKIYKTLRGHTDDVSDLTWSVNRELIISSGVDCRVIVWDVAKATKIHRLQKEHASYALGVAFDPFERYIASISNDRSLLIFSSKTGKTLQHIDRHYLPANDDGKVNDENNANNANSVELSSNKSSNVGGEDNDSNEAQKNNDNNVKKFVRLFHDQNMMAFCRRLTFTPGGEFLLVPSGIIEKENEEPGNAVHIFSRKSLDKPAFYLPTRKFSLVVRCCPIQYELRKENPSNIMGLPYRVIFAVGTEDAVYFYDSQQAEPFAYIAEIHYLRLTDLSWSSDGRFLMVTSSDGFVSFIVFDHGELGSQYTGKKLTLEELEPVPLTSQQKKAKKVRETKLKEEKENKDDNGSPARRKSEKANKTPITVRQESGNNNRLSAKKNDTKSTPPKSQNITKFFTKISTPTLGDHSSSPSASVRQNITATLPKKNCESPAATTPKSGCLAKSTGSANKSARRVSLITLFTAKKNDEPKPGPVSTESDNSVEFIEDISNTNNNLNNKRKIDDLESSF